MIYFEAIIIIAVIVYQIYYSRRIYKNALDLGSIFSKNLFVVYKSIPKSAFEKKEIVISKILNEEEITFENDSLSDSQKDYILLAITDTKGNNHSIKNIKYAVNNYLLNNYGAPVNFSIIKDIIDREVDIQDEEISQSLPTPLYLGLAATMVGIIFGLLSMPSISDTFSLVGIDALINGVKLAMTASLSGLVCTTILSSGFYKKEKKKVIIDKNAQLSYLQAKLLPELIKAEDTGVSGLKTSLDHFSREASRIAHEMNLVVYNTGRNIQSEQDVLSRIEKLNITKVSKATIELFDKIDKNMPAYTKFSDFLSLMEKISENLKEFAARTSNVDSVTNQINSSLQESSKLTRFLSTHFEKIESAGIAALEAVDITDSYFRDAIDKLKQEIDARIANMNSKANLDESKLTEIYNTIIDKLTTITSEHIDQFTAAYSNAVPKFNKLDHLDNLMPIKETLASKTDILVNNSQNSNNEIVSKLNTIISHFKNNGSSNEYLIRLEKAINDLTKQITGKEPSKTSKWQWIRKSEPFLKIITYIIIIGCGCFFIYSILFR